MSTGTIPTLNSSVIPAELRECDAVIQTQLDRTRRQVRMVDLATVGAGWVAGVLAALMVAAVIDHWLAPLGPVGRWGILAAIVAGSLYCAWQFLAPLALRQINPVYAAQAIEHSQPSLKNSLINFLLLRNDSRGVKEGILHAVERQAAADIADVPVDLAVDRSHAIRLGYLLVGILAISALYKIVSPKDPFQTAARVLAPWASIARPSRVQIVTVEPGNLEVYQGQSVTVLTNIQGLRGGEPTVVRYSTADGRVADRAVALVPAPDGVRWQCVLPPDADSKDTKQGLPGLQQDVAYRVIAGDAVSETYHLRVRPAPTMLVERVNYQFPQYTKRPPQKQERGGDVQALEGTRVTIHGRANQPIKTATIEFDPATLGSGRPTADTLNMLVDGERASVTFVLELRPDRHTPQRGSYQLRFYNDRGERSEQPTLHRIDVLPDLPPEIQILAPTQPKIEVPLDGEALVEVRAVDPDFGLAKVGLRGLRDEEIVVDQALLDPKDVGALQGTFKFTFKPAKHKLKQGDEVHYWAWVEDGRMSPQGASEPNVARTPTYLFVITAPVNPPANDPDRKPKPGEESKPDDNPKPGEKSETKPGDKPKKPAGDKPEKPMADKPNDKAGEKPEKPGEKSEGNEKEPGKPENKGGQQSKPQKPDDKSGGNKKDKQQGGNESGGKEGGESGAQGGASGKGNEQGKEKEPQEGASGGAGGNEAGSQGGEKTGEGGSEGKPNGQSSGKKPGDKSGQAGEKQQGSGAGGKEQEGSRENGGEGGEPTAGKPGEGARGGQGAKPQHDGEAFERILERMKEQNGGKPGEKPGDKPMGGEKNGENGGQPGEKTQSGENTAGKSGEKGNAGEQSPSARKAEQGAAGDKEQGSGGAAGDPKPDQANDKHGKEGAEGGEKKAGEKPTGPQKPDSRRGAGGKQDAAPGEGGDPQNADRTDMGKKEGESGADQGQKKDPGMGDTGASGAGQNSKDKTGSGEGTEANRDKPKNQSEGSTAPKDGETSAASGSKKQSDSKGGESGDQSGGGKKGAGQSAGQEGNDSPGSKSAADQGAGKANERGSGETGPKGGQEQKTDGQTGSAGKEAGNGSSSKPGEGKEPGGQGKETGKPDGGKEGTSGESGKQRGNGPVDGGGIPHDQPMGDVPPTKEGTAPDGEAANLDYTKKATDLALDYLKDQEHDPDPELLKRLGWTPDELREFTRRWEALQKSAVKDPNEKRELDESLKSLGLRPPKQDKRAGGKTDDSFRDLRDTGSRTQPPAKYREQFDAFRKGKK